MAYTLYGWHLSYFTGKSLCYLRYKQVDFELKSVNMYTLMHTIKKKTGAAVMPVMVTPDKEWVQDTSVIIDYIEARHPKNPVLPSTPVQQYASRLLEAWGDEWWIPIAMHTRWTYSENYKVFEHDVGSALLPWAPKFIQNKVAAQPATYLRTLLPSVGIIPSQYEIMNNWTFKMLDALDAHFAQYPFLLGDRPTLGDFSLVGTMYGHLGRDPWPKREMVDPRRHLSAWLERMKNPAKYSGGELVSNDEIPDTLRPVFDSIFQEWLPLVEGVGQLAVNFALKKGVGTTLPRRIGTVKTTMAGAPFERGALSYMIWMQQRVNDCYESMSSTDQVKVRTWLKGFGGEHTLNLSLPRVKRVALSVAVESLPVVAQRNAA